MLLLFAATCFPQFSIIYHNILGNLKEQESIKNEKIAKIVKKIKKENQVACLFETIAFHVPCCFILFEQFHESKRFPSSIKSNREQYQIIHAKNIYVTKRRDSPCDRLRG